jgi:hypothetical protein
MMSSLSLSSNSNATKTRAEPMAQGAATTAVLPEQQTKEPPQQPQWQQISPVRSENFYKCLVEIHLQTLYE